MRQSNFELLRIISMIFIVMGHVVYLHHSSTFGDSLIDFYLYPFICVSVNIYMLITGYFGIRFRAQRIMKLISQTWFYCVAGLLFLCSVGYHHFSWYTDFRYFMPVLTRQYWFVTAYVVLYLLSPTLNFIIEKFSKWQYQRMLLIVGLILYVWSSFSEVTLSLPLIHEGSLSFVNMIYMYFLGRYIKLYYLPKRSRSFYLFIYFACSLLIGLIHQLFSSIMGFRFTPFIGNNTFLMLINSIALFLFFLKFRFYSKTINLVAAPSLAVYLWHCGPWEMCKYLNITLGLTECHSLFYLLVIGVSGICAYIIGFILETLREFLFASLESIFTKYAIKFVYKLRLLKH